MDNSEPKILCYMCNWTFCQEETSVPSNVNVVRVTCIGRIDPVIVLDTFANGADGVMLIGCKPPNCHFVKGNLQAERGVEILNKLLSLSDLESERLKLLWSSPSENSSLSCYVKEFSEEIRNLGISPVNSEQPESTVMLNLMAAKNAASNFRLRVLLGREEELTEALNVYGEKIPQEEFNGLLDEIVEVEFVRHKIRLLTWIKPLPVKVLAEEVEMKPSDVLRHIVNMRRRNMIALDHIEGQTPFYRALEVE
ncbi:MAG TPA: hydrogenase iron-sulfur subunit [Candidatus Bathyarchaeia archaeon]